MQVFVPHVQSKVFGADASVLEQRREGVFEHVLVDESQYLPSWTAKQIFVPHLQSCTLMTEPSEEAQFGPFQHMHCSLEEQVSWFPG